ncbi:hypothetical protein L6R52_05730 [Myxococcota bacterium]|nr:hypothetical protein [Myxococcota bacterium]
MLRRLAIVVLFALSLAPSSAIAGDSLDLRAWLDRPGVKLVAVELYATWCKPCMDAVQKWKALHERYASQGFRLIVVATQDPKGGCVNPGWNPDEVVCDEEGFIARIFGAGETLPAAFLWTWQGRLLVRQGHVEHVEAAIEKWMREAPRVDLEVAVDRDGGTDAASLKQLVRSKLNDYDKLVVVATKEERDAIDRLKKRSFDARYDDKLQCEVGKELSANSLLQVRGRDARAPAHDDAAHARPARPAPARRGVRLLGARVVGRR